MPDSELLAEVAAAISLLQSVLASHGLGRLCGITVSDESHARLSSLRLSDMVELDSPRPETNPEILGVPIQRALKG